MKSATVPLISVDTTCMHIKYTVQHLDFTAQRTTKERGKCETRQPTWSIDMLKLRDEMKLAWVGYKLRLSKAKAATSSRRA